MVPKKYEAKIKDTYTWPIANACGGEEFIKEIYRPVPELRVKEAHDTPYLDVREVVEITIKASPVAKKLAEEYNIDILDVEPSGKDGSITKGDVEAYLEGYTDEDDEKGEKAKEVEGEVVEEVVEEEDEIDISKSALALALEYDLDLDELEGTGEKGKIIKPDVEAYISEHFEDADDEE